MESLQAQLEFYRQKASQQENERREWQHLADTMRQQMEDIHSSENESALIKQQIAELQKALSDSHLAIYDEKSHFLQLQRQYQLHQQQERNDKRKLLELQALSEELTKQEGENSDFKNFKDVRPQALAQAALQKKQKAEKLAAKKDQGFTNQLIVQKLNERPTSAATPKVLPKSRGGIVKTVILPNEDVNRLNSETETLYDVLQQQEMLFNDTVQGYQKDRIVRQQEFDLKQRDFQEQIIQLQHRLQERKELNYKLSTEYFAYKNATVQDNNRLTDAIELAKVEQEQLLATIEKVVTVEEQNSAYNSQLYQTKTKQFANRFRKASLKNEEELNIIKVQFAEVQNTYLVQIKKLKKQLKQVQKRANDIQDQRIRESSMYSGDVESLRQRVSQYEKHIKKLKQYVDKEDTDALVKELEEEQNLPDLNLIAQEIAQVTKQVAEARKIKV